MAFTKEQRAEWRKRNREKIRAYTAEWKRDNPDRVAEHDAKASEAV